MSTTDAMIAADIAGIFADLAGTSITETVERIPAGETSVDGSFSILRAKQRKAEEMLPDGFATEYRFSIYTQRADIGETTEGDILVMANGDRLRVLRLTEQPARIVTMLDLGDEFGAGDEY